MKATDLNVGDYIRSPKDAGKIYQVREKRGETNILVWRYDTEKKVLAKNDFMFINGADEIQKVTI